MKYSVTDILDVLSDSTSDNLFNINSMFIMEKATREQYRLSAFKKKYNYNPSDKTITVDGEKYKVDLDIKNPFIIIDGKRRDLRTVKTRTVDGEPIIYIDDIFFKLKNSKRRDAVLQHEIGHEKLHNINSNHIDRNKISEKIFDNIYDINKIRSMTINECKYRNINYFNKDEYTKVYNEIYNYIKKYKTKYLNLANMDSVDKQIRDDIFMIAKKYENKNNSHTKAIEFEADRYSANRTSSGDVKRSLQERNKYKTTEKQIKKDIKNEIKMKDNSSDPENKLRINIAKKEYLNDKTIKNQIKEQHKSDKIDYDARSKALKDENLKKSKVYK